MFALQYIFLILFFFTDFTLTFASIQAEAAGACSHLLMNSVV